MLQCISARMRRGILVGLGCETGQQGIRCLRTGELNTSSNVADRVECAGASGCRSRFHRWASVLAPVPAQPRSLIINWARHCMPRQAVPSNVGGRCRATCFEVFVLKVRLRGRRSLAGGVNVWSGTGSLVTDVGFHLDSISVAPPTHSGSG